MLSKYTLSYTLEGYSPAENDVDVTTEMYANAQKGVATQLDDVILIKEASVDNEAGIDGHRYQVFEIESITSWEDAKAYCESLGRWIGIEIYKLAFWRAKWPESR